MDNQPHNPAGGQGAPNPGEHDLGPDPTAALIADLEARLADAEHKYKLALAEHHNYARRALQNELVAKDQGKRSVVETLIPVLDHFELALAMDASKASAESVIGGVRLIREEFLKALQVHGVGQLSPAPGDEFTPGRHEAVMQQPHDALAAGLIVSTLQPGFTLGDRVIRAAKVIVSSGPPQA